LNTTRIQPVKKSTNFGLQFAPPLRWSGIGLEICFLEIDRRTAGGEQLAHLNDCLSLSRLCFLAFYLECRCAEGETALERFDR
jgi:hypothetical protein